MLQIKTDKQVKFISLPALVGFYKMYLKWSKVLYTNVYIYEVFIENLLIFIQLGQKVESV
jgi:hypothetical protein